MQFNFTFANTTKKETNSFVIEKQTKNKNKNKKKKAPFDSILALDTFQTITKTPDNIN